jgi:hypothetical protein
MNKEDKCIVIGCRCKKISSMNFCNGCYTYFIFGKTNNCKASKNDIKNLEYIENIKIIDKELERINGNGNGKQIEMNYEKEIT